MPLPVVKVYLLPAEWDEAKFQQLFTSLVRAAKGIPEWDIKDENDILVVFPSDRMKKGLGTDVLVEVDLPDNRVPYPHAAQDIAIAMAHAVSGHLDVTRQLYVQCKVYTFSAKEEQGCYEIKR